MYQYRAFGLHIQSDIQLPELISHSFAAADITIALGKTPATLTGNDVVQKVNVWISPVEYLIKLLDIANYHVKNGSNITVEPLAGADDASVRLFLLTGVMAAALHQRNKAMINASGIIHNGEVVLFCGWANTGKSTIVAHLKKDGYKVFTDEVCLLDTSPEGKIQALASYPVIKLWEYDFSPLTMQPLSADLRIRPRLPKYALYFHNDFVDAAMPVKQVFVLNKTPMAKDVKIKKLTQVDAFIEIYNQLYYRLQVFPMKKEPVYFAAISQLTKTVDSYKINRPTNGDTFKEVYNAIKNTLANG